MGINLSSTMVLGAVRYVNNEILICSWSSSGAACYLSELKGHGAPMALYYGILSEIYYHDAPLELFACRTQVIKKLNSSWGHVFDYKLVLNFDF